MHHLEMSHGIIFFFIELKVEKIKTTVSLAECLYVSELLTSLTSDYCSFYPT